MFFKSTVAHALAWVDYGREQLHLKRAEINYLGLTAGSLKSLTLLRRNL